MHTGHVLISEMLYFEKIWVWSDCLSYYESEFPRPVLILCSVSCSVAVVRLEGSFGHATGRTSSSWTHYCVARSKVGNCIKGNLNYRIKTDLRPANSWTIILTGSRQKNLLTCIHTCKLVCRNEIIPCEDKESLCKLQFGMRDTIFWKGS